MIRINNRQYSFFFCRCDKVNIFCQPLLTKKKIKFNQPLFSSSEITIHIYIYIYIQDFCFFLLLLLLFFLFLVPPNICFACLFCRTAFIVAFHTYMCVFVYIYINLFVYSIHFGFFFFCVGRKQL